MPKTSNARTIINRITGDDPDLHAMIALGINQCESCSTYLRSANGNGTHSRRTSSPYGYKAAEYRSS